MSGSSNNPYIVLPVRKALAVLAYVAERGHDVSLTPIGKALKIPKTTTFRYLQTLVDAGFLRHDAVTDKYGIGVRFRTIAKADSGINNIRQLAHRAMHELAGEFNETVNLAVRSNSNVVYIDLVEANRPLRMQAKIGESHPMHATALGKAILAFLPEGEAQNYFAAPLAERTGRTLVDRDEIERQLRQVRKLGYATETGENEDGAMCVGAPIFNEAGYPVAAVSISAPLSRMSRPLATQAAKRLIDAVGRISAQLGSSHHELFMEGM